MIMSRLIRAISVLLNYLLADMRKVNKEIGWEPRVYFKDLVRIMVDADLELIGLDCPGEGRKIMETHHGRWHRWEDQISSMEGNH